MKNIHTRTGSEVRQWKMSGNKNSLVLNTTLYGIKLEGFMGTQKHDEETLLHKIKKLQDENPNF